MNTKINKKGHTFAEILITMGIIVTLSSIAIYSYINNLSNTRNSERKTIINKIETELNLFKQNKGAYPLPNKYINITNKGYIVARQGFFNNNIILSKPLIDIIDPLNKREVSYSILKNRQEMQLSMTIETETNKIAIVKGNYKTVSQNVLPSILLGIDSYTNIEINEGVGDGGENRKKFIFNNGTNLTNNLEKKGEKVFYNNKTFNQNLNEINVKIIQDSSFKICTEIKEAKKYIHNSSTEEYQILNSNGELVNINCNY